MRPDGPPMTFPGRVMNELNSAYWVAVYRRETRLDRKAMNTVAEKPLAKLSAPMVTNSAGTLAPTVASQAKTRLVIATSNAPISNMGMMPKRATTMPPMMPPTRVIAMPNTLVTVAIWDSEKPRSRYSGLAIAAIERSLIL